MCRAYQSLAISLILALHSSYALGQQPISRIDPCDLMYHGRALYGDEYPEISHFIVSRMPHLLPVEIHLNYSIPEKYKPIARKTALEWNTKAGIELITISDEIDDSQWNTQQVQLAPKNVIYWLNDDQYNLEDITANQGFAKAGSTTFIKGIPVDPSIPYVFIFDSDIVMYEEQNNITKVAHWVFTLSLKRIGIEPPEAMDTLGLQDLFVEELSNMSSDDFYNMVIKLMEEKQVTLPTSEPEAIKEWILERINQELENTQLVSFEDLKALMVEEYSFDLTSIFDSSAQLFKRNLLHELGHTLGLNHNGKANSLMHDGVSLTLLPQFPRNFVPSAHVDDLALHGLKCSYDLEGLRQIPPL